MWASATTVEMGSARSEPESGAFGPCPTKEPRAYTVHQNVTVLFAIVTSFVRQCLIFFQNLWDRAKNMAVSVMITTFRLSHSGVGQQWDSGTSSGPPAHTLCFKMNAPGDRERAFLASRR